MPLGDSFFLGNDRNAKLHEYVVISRADPTGKVLCVSFRSAHGHQYDKSCVVKPGEFAHAFIRSLTFVDYSEAKAIDTEIIRVNLQGRRWLRGESVPEGLVKRMQEGATKTDAIPAKFADYLRLM